MSPLRIFSPVNFVGSKISSTENDVLWMSGNFASAGCISACSGPLRAQVISVGVCAYMYYLFEHHRGALKFTCHSKRYPNEAMRLPETIAPSALHVRTICGTLGYFKM